MNKLSLKDICEIEQNYLTTSLIIYSPNYIKRI